MCSENLKFCSKRILYLLSMLFTSLLVHGYLPQQLMEIILIPVIKNKCGNVSDSGNYRPIAIANIISKVLESILLSRCEEFLYTTDNQFGFKPNHSTDMCIYTLKEVIHFISLGPVQYFSALLMLLKRLAELTITNCLRC